LTSRQKDREAASPLSFFCALRLRAKIPDPRYPKELRTIGDHLRKRLLDLGLRQKDVGALVGAARPTVDAWEHRGTRPSGEVLRRLVQFLGHEPAEAASPAALVRQLSALRRELHLARSDVAEMLGLSYDPSL
jgi:transcriptional regulator with XRE-family HTH domain